MKTILTLLALSTATLIVQAQEDGNYGPPPGGPDQGGPGRHRPPLPLIVRALDVNHDGIIDSNEIANATAELLTLDTNHDGQLTFDEYMGKRPAHHHRPSQDQNGDSPAGPPPDGGTNMPPPSAGNGPDQGPPGQDDYATNGAPGQGGGDNQGPPHRHPPIPALVLALDVNKDGILESNEIANASNELLTLDKNGDGQLTRDEYMGQHQRPPRQDDNDGMDGPPGGGSPPQQ